MQFKQKIILTVIYSFILSAINARYKNDQLLEHMIRPDGTMLQAFFTPYNRIQDVIVALIDHEQESIEVASYVFTNHAISNALAQAQARNVDVRIIVDRSTITNNRINHEIYELARSTHLYIFKELSRGIMHNKFGIFARNIHNMSIVLTGSFNWTFSAQKYNFENIVVSNDQSLINQYHETFKLLLEQSTPAEQLLTPLSWPLSQFPVAHRNQQTVAHLVVSCKSLASWLRLALWSTIDVPNQFV